MKILPKRGTREFDLLIWTVATIVYEVAIICTVSLMTALVQIALLTLMMGRVLWPSVREYVLLGTRFRGERTGEVYRTHFRWYISKIVVEGKKVNFVSTEDLYGSSYSMTLKSLKSEREVVITETKELCRYFRLYGVCPTSIRTSYHAGRTGKDRLVYYFTVSRDEVDFLRSVSSATHIVVYANADEELYGVLTKAAERLNIVDRETKFSPADSFGVVWRQDCIVPPLEDYPALSLGAVIKQSVGVFYQGSYYVIMSCYGMEYDYPAEAIKIEFRDEKVAMRYINKALMLRR